MSTGPLNSAAPTTATLIGGVYNVTSPAPAAGQESALQIDANGNLLVNIAAGGGAGGIQYVDGATQATPTGTVALAKNPSNILHALGLSAAGNLNVNLAEGTISGGNAAASATGGAVPVNADYSGINIGGNLTGRTGFSLGSQVAASVAIVDGAGNQIASFGGGTQFADNAASGAAPTGTLSMGWDSVNSKVRALKVDASQDLLVAFPAAQHIIVDSGSITANIGTTSGLALDASLTTLDTDLKATQPRDVTDRVGRLLGHVTVDNASIAVTGTFWQATQPVSIGAAVDVSDRAARLLGVVYGSQAQQLKQTATNFNLQTELATGGTLYDARQIRALTSADVVSAAQSGLWNVNQAIGVAGFEKITDGTNTAAVKAASTAAVAADPALVVAISPNNSVAVTGTFFQGTQPVSIAAAVDVSDRTARLLGHVTVDNASLAVTGTFFQVTQPVSIAGTVNVSVQNATLAVTQNTSPWVENVSQFGGNPVVTGTGVSGAGIPRVTVSSDSFPVIQAVSATSLPLPSGASTDANLIGGNEVRSQMMLILESTRRAIVALACEGGRNNPRDFDPGIIASEEGADDFAD